MKKWAFILCCVLSFGLLLTGCGNNAVVLKASDEIVYNGSSAVRVGDYLYFGNGMYQDFTSVSGMTNESQYNKAAGLAYLAKLNVNSQLLSDGIDYSPKGVSKFSGNVATFTGSSSMNSFVFAIGNNIFYATPNTWRTTGGTYHFEYTTFYRNGTEIYSTRDLYASVQKIEALKFDGKFYLLMLAGDKLVKLNLSNGATQTLEGVTSVAMPKTYRKDQLGSTSDWDGTLYYTKDNDDSNVGDSNVYQVSISDMTTKKSQFVPLDGTGKFTLIDREVGYVDGKLLDEVFYTCTNGDGQTQTYKMTKREKEITYPDEETEGQHTEIATFYDSELFVDSQLQSGTTIQRVLTHRTGVEDDEQYVVLQNLGYIYTSSGTVNYVSAQNKGTAINFVDESKQAISYDSVVAIDESKVILASASNIYIANISELFDGENEVLAQSVVNKSDIFTSGALFAYDGEYVYYYAKLNAIETEEDEDQSKTGNDDANYYFFRSNLQGTYGDENYQLLGITENGFRNSK